MQLLATAVGDDGFDHRRFDRQLKLGQVDAAMKHIHRLVEKAEPLHRDRASATLLDPSLALLLERQSSHAAASSSSSGSVSGGIVTQRPRPSKSVQVTLLNVMRGRHVRLLRACLARGRLDLLAEYVSLLPPEPRVFTALMKEAAVRGRVDVLHLILQARDNSGLRRDAYCYSAMAMAAGTAGDAAALHRTWSEAMQRGVANTVLANVVANQLAQLGDYKGVALVHDELAEAGLEPDTATCNALLRAARVAGAGAVARALFEGMQEGRGRPPPDSYSYTLLFNAAAASPAAFTGDWLLKVYGSLPTVGVTPNMHIFTSFLAALSAMPLEPAQLEAAMRIVSDAREAGQCSGPVYGALLSLCTRHGAAERVLDVWEAMLEDGVRCDGHQYSALFAAAAAAAHVPEMQDLVHRVYTHMHASVVGQQSDRATLLAAHNALLHFLGRCGEVGQAVAVFRAMRESGPAPDAITYNTLISAHASLGDLEAAICLFQDLQQTGMSATTRTYVSLMNACAKAGRTDVAQRLMSLMEEGGVVAEVHSYTAFMDACVREGSAQSLALAFDVFKRMRAAGVAPTVVTYGCLLQACEAQQDVEKAFALYRQACSEGLLPTDECHNVLIQVCIKARRLDEALDLVKGLARKHGSMQLPMLNSLIRALAVPYPDRALRMLALMRTWRMQPNRGTFLSLVVACARSSKSSVSLSLYCQMRAARMVPSREAGSALITSLARAGEVADAEWVYADMHACAAQGQEQGASRSSGPAVSPRALPKRSLLPSTDAVASLAAACARQGLLARALELFRSVAGDDKRLAPLTLSHRQMWECLIESCCRRNNIGTALWVFDRWKAATLVLLKDDTIVPPASVLEPDPHPARPAMRVPLVSTPAKEMLDTNTAAAAAMPTRRFPKLSSVTLAFLEACCRRQPQYEWRVYDVCAEMRQAKERRLQSQLARPPKPSHHFLDEA